MSTPKVAIFGNGMTGKSPFEQAARQGQEQIEAMKAHQQMGYEQGVKSERERLAVLVQSAKNLRSELKLYGSERFEWATYEDVMTNPVDCLIQALEDYESEK